MNKPVKTKIQGSILEVTIDRPKANAIDAKTSIILGDIFSDFRALCDVENFSVF